MKISSKEIHVLKNLLVGKTFAEVAGILGVSSFANSDFKSTTSILKSEEFDRIQKDLLLAYKENINKPDFEKLKNKIVINTVKLGLSPALLHFYHPQGETKNVVQERISSKVTGKRKSKQKASKQLKEQENRKRIAAAEKLKRYENELEKAKQKHQNQHSGVYYFLNFKLKKYYSKSITIAQFEKSFGIERGQIKLYLKQKGQGVNDDDPFTFQIAYSISDKLYEAYLSKKLENSKREAYYKQTENKPPKTKPNYYKLIFTR